MKLVKEHINFFTRGLDPKIAMGTGIDALIEPYSFYNLFGDSPGTLYHPIPKLFHEKDPRKYFLIGGDTNGTRLIKSGKQSNVVKKALEIISNYSPAKHVKDDYYADNGSNLVLYVTDIGKIVTIDRHYLIFGDRDAAINLQIWTNKTIIIK